MKTQTFPLKVSEQGVSAKIRKVNQTKNGNQYTFFMVDYVLLGKRKQEWHTDLASAKAAALDACRKIAAGEQKVLELKNDDRLAYIRAMDALVKTNVPIDTACRDFADALTILAGVGSLSEAARFFVKSHCIEYPRMAVPAAIEEMIAQATREGKSADRIHQLESYLNRFKAAFNCNVTEVTAKQITDFIIGLNVKERTKKNCRDVLKAFFAWCVGRGYLAKDKDPVEHAEKYSGKREEEVEIFTAEELGKLIAAADNRLLPYLVIQAFAGIRGREIQKLDWSAVDLADGFITISAKIAKTGVRRLVPIKPNLRAWLLPLAQKSGPVCSFKNIYNQLVDLATAAGVEWKKNALRHSYISYRVAECADVPRVAEESGNSPAIIRSNYLNCRKPWEAAQWFGMIPGNAPEAVKMPTPEEAKEMVAKTVVALPTPAMAAA